MNKLPHDHRVESIAWAAATIAAVSLIWVGLPLWAVLLGGIAAPFVVSAVEAALSS